MNSPINKIAIIGTGVIGAGWTIRLLAKNIVVNVYDPNISQLHFLKNEIRRVSKPGRRVYSSVRGLPYFYDGLGISIVSTPQGLMSDSEAREKNVGGEILCKVF